MASILIAEDDAHVARVLSIWLQRHGHCVRTVANGHDALAAMEQHPADLVITDMNMPGLDGVQLVRETRLRWGPALPIIVLSARCDQRELGSRLEKLGAELFPKPFLPSQLVEEIDRRIAAASQAEWTP